MHPGGVPSAMHLFNFEKSANLKHPNVHPLGYTSLWINDKLTDLTELHSCIKDNFLFLFEFFISKTGLWRVDKNANK